MLQEQQGMLLRMHTELQQCILMSIVWPANLVMV